MVVTLPHQLMLHYLPSLSPFSIKANAHIKIIYVYLKNGREWLKKMDKITIFKSSDNLSVAFYFRDLEKKKK